MTWDLMTWEEFLTMSEHERACAFNQLNPHDDPRSPIFEAVQSAFLSAHPQFGPPNEVEVGEIGRVGPFNGIVVRVATDAKLRVPRKFLGLRVEKVIRLKNGSWRPAR